MNILAINFNHDGAAAVMRDGRLSGYVNTERFSRRRKHPGVRCEEVEEVLRQARIALNEIDLVQLINLNSIDSQEIPVLHGTTLKETWPDFWLKGDFTRIRLNGVILPCELLSGHHLYHAALAAVFSPFDAGVSLAIDPVGARAYFFNENTLTEYRGVLSATAARVYALVSRQLFGTALLGAGKLMGLAPYGRTVKAINFEDLSRLQHRPALLRLLEIANAEGAFITEDGKTLDAGLAYYAQQFLEHEISNMLSILYAECLSNGVPPNLCLSGGVALNSAANQLCFSKSKFEQLYLHPACGDDGMPIGAGLHKWHFELKHPKEKRTNREAMYSVRTYEEAEILSAVRLHENRVCVEAWKHPVEVVKLLVNGWVVGWFQGASEIGPRALGNRSILADPRAVYMRDYINIKIKRRERFRPFAPAVLADKMGEYFGMETSPFMLRIAAVLKATVPAITHVDGTSRPQSVARDDNPKFYDLVNAFYEETGCPMLLNTSFNGKDEPIVETPLDAIRCMLASGLDCVVFPNLVVFNGIEAKGRKTPTSA